MRLRAIGRVEMARACGEMDRPFVGHPRGSARCSCANMALALLTTRPMRTVVTGAPAAPSLAAVVSIFRSIPGPFVLALSLACGACGGQERSAPNPANAPPPTAMDGGMAPQSEMAPAPAPTYGVGRQAPWPGTAGTSAGATSPMPSAGGTTGAAAPMSPPPAQASAAPQVAPPPLRDAEILRVVEEANQGEIAQANLAMSKSTESDVKKLATTLWHDHTDAEAKGAAIAKKERLTMEASPLSATFKSEARAATGQLEALTGAGFDRAYVDAQIRGHQSLIDAIDQRLLPAAQNADIRAYLADVRARAVEHLQRAQDLQGRIHK
jgi:putative membrane protein